MGRILIIDKHDYRNVLLGKNGAFCHTRVQGRFAEVVLFALASVLLKPAKKRMPVLGI